MSLPIKFFSAHQKWSDKKEKYKEIPTVNNQQSILKEPITTNEIQESLKEMKNNKAAGIDDVCTEQLTYVGPGAA